MARKSPPERDDDAGEAPPPPRPLWRRAFQPWLLFRLAVFAAFGLALPRLGELLPDLGARSEYRVAARDVSITPPPRWIKGDLVQQVFDAAKLPEDLSLLDDGLNARLAAAFREHAWISEVRSVRKAFPASVFVELEYRRPVAMIQVPEGLYPVDLHGTLLPPGDFSPSRAGEYPLILGVRSTPLRGLGADWGDPLVPSAAALASALAPHWKDLQLEAIVCPRNRDEPFLLTAQGSQILWGRPPDKEDPSEPTTVQKIGRLEKYIADCGGFDRPRGPYEIDIRHFREISRRPLATERSSRPRNDLR